MRRSSSVVLRGEWLDPCSLLSQVRTCYLVRWEDTDWSRGQSLIFVYDKHGHCVTLRHLASEFEEMRSLLEDSSTTCNHFLEMSFPQLEHSFVESPLIRAAKELSYCECWEILERWHVDFLVRRWKSTEKAFQQYFTFVSLPCEIWRMYVDADLVLDSNLSLRVFRRGRAKSYEERVQSQEWLSSVPSIDRSRHIWVTQVLVQFYSSLPLERVDMSGPKVSKAALGGKHGLDYFVHLYLKKFEKNVPANVRIFDLEPTPAEIVLTQQCLCGWWQDKLQIGLQDWPGFRMDEEQVEAITVRAVLYASLQLSTWREMNIFIAAVSRT